MRALEYFIEQVRNAGFADSTLNFGAGEPRMPCLSAHARLRQSYDVAQSF